METRIGCGDNSCIFSDAKPSGGMGTNGGCRCFENLESWIESEKRWNREEVRHVRQSVMIQQRMYRDKIKELEKKIEELEKQLTNPSILEMLPIARFTNRR